MAESLGENFDKISLGNASEGASEAAREQAKQRNQRAAKRVAKVQKDEAFAKEYDLTLAKIIPKLPLKIILFVAYLIEKNIPGLTILAFISLLFPEAQRAVAEEMKKNPTPPAFPKSDASLYKISTAQTEEIDQWWNAIFSTDTISTSTHISDLVGVEGFVQRLAEELSRMILEYFDRHHIQEYDKQALESTINSRGRMLLRLVHPGDEEDL